LSNNTQSPSSSPSFENPIAEGISGQKKKILWYLKVMQQAGLEELATVMKISRMGAHKHLSGLQKRGLVEAIESRTGVGRPKMIYKLTVQSKTVFPKSYASIATYSLDFIEKNMGKEGVVNMLRERQNDLFSQYYERLKDLNFGDRVKELAKIRDEEGYIAESKKNNSKGDSGHILFEYNCPIIHIAERHWEACSTETELFEKLLDANIETTHRAAKGDLVCKFAIKEKKDGYL
jgi:predicted ArsR family transcriptional regulator